jgi:hypothetical protein
MTKQMKRYLKKPDNGIIPPSGSSISNVSLDMAYT